MFYILTLTQTEHKDHKILQLVSLHRSTYQYKFCFTPRKKGIIFHKAFTLAEVLITLLIIGVVASIVVPNLINDIQDTELKTSWKKIYSDLNQASKRIMMDNGGTFAGLFTSSDSVRNLFTNYMVSSKICNSTTILGNCWHDNNDSSFYFNKEPVSTWPQTAGIILNSGALICFVANSSTCTFDHGIPICGRFFIDINGFKKPNTVGKDIYGIWITSNGIKPFGTHGDWYDPNDNDYGCKSSANGLSCAAKYLYQ